MSIVKLPNPHNHGNSVMSAVLYLKTTKDVGGITFKDFTKPVSIYFRKIQTTTFGIVIHGQFIHTMVY